MGRWASLIFVLCCARGEDACRALVQSRQEAKARDCYFAAAKSTSDPRQQADLLYQAGRSQAALAAFPDAIRTYLGVLELRRQLADRRAEATTLNDIGSAHWSLGENREGLRYFEDALRIRIDIGETYGAAVSRFGIGHIHAAWGDTDLAIADYTEALKSFRQLKNERFEAEVLNALGLTYANIGDYTRAQRAYQDALVLWRKLSLKGREAYTLNNFGLLELDRRAPAVALDYFNQALPMLEEARDVRAQAYARNNQGDAELALHHLQRALELYSTSLDLKNKVGDQAGAAHTLERMGEALAAADDLPGALHRFNEALELQRKVGSRPGEAVTLGARARVLRSLSRLDEARHDIAAALGVIEGLRSQISNRDLRTTFFSTRQDYYTFEIDLLMSMNQPVAALEANERSRARGLLDMLQEAKVDPRDGVAPELLDRKRAAERDLRVLGQRAASGEKLEQALREWNDADAAIRRGSPRYAALMTTDPVSVAAIQRDLLDPGTALIEYGLGDHRSFAWFVTQDSIQSATLPPRARIDALVRRALTSLAARNQRSPTEEPEARARRIEAADRAFDSIAGELGRILLGPFAGDVRSRRLLIVPDGSLHYVPFAALRLPGNGRTLLASNEVLWAPSASIVGALRAQEHQQRPRGAVFAVADPVFDSADSRVLGEAGAATGSGAEFEYTRLRFSRGEADTITALAPARSRALLDFDANREAVLSARLHDYRIVHFATHAEIDNDHPALSRIVLSQVDRRAHRRDGSIRLFEIFNLKLNADVVVLSACRSALGQEIRGEGLMGLTRGFLYAGASAVLASLWDVEDRATASLMKGFYQATLLSGIAPGQALRRAQLAVAADERWASPYYWASFTLQGDWKNVRPLR